MIGVRMDTWLWAARFFKTRPLAKRACELGRILSNGQPAKAAREVIAKYPENVAKFKSGNEGVFKFFVGQVMKATRGQANPQSVNDILRKLLS